MTKTTGSVLVKFDLIDPDPLQPRKSFDASRLAELAQSIKKHGIMNPLIIEKAQNGRFTLVDGERRYRASKILKLSEVPAVIVEAQTDIQRLIQQFHLQEQHQSWSATEKAVAVSKLAKDLGYSISQMAEVLNLPTRSIGDYVAFANLLDRAKFEKEEIPLGYASRMVSLRRHIKKLWLDNDKEFTRDMEEKLETSLIKRVKSGDIRTGYDFTKIRDVFTADLTAVTRFIKDESSSTDKFFIDSTAKAQAHVRNMMYNANAILTHARQLRLLGGKKHLPADTKVLDNVIKELQALID